MTETKVPPRELKWTPPPNTLWFMSDETRRARPATQYGATAEAVAHNVQRLRKARALSIYQLSALLKKAGRPITPAAVGKLERQQRQVNVDDLAALAVIFGVSPSALLLPLEDSEELGVEVTGGGTVPADVAWDWADGKRPLHWPQDTDPGTASYEYRLYGRPPGRRDAHGVVLRPRGERGRLQVEEIRRAYSALQEHGLDIRELQRLDVDAFEQLMREGDG
ncbi:helix-turn-helix transcriptional regulator [Streptomyces sp. NPDC013489]|uniref:helix-turn-helix domain-containing protein n=1 Tax=Streptomyces sp. NPDC013489 TaxID=3155606 RepID=UPI0033F7C037